AARRLRPEVSKNSSTALSSNEGELARSITSCAPAMASLSPSPVMLLIPLLGEAAPVPLPACLSHRRQFQDCQGPGAAQLFSTWVQARAASPIVLGQAL